MSEHIRFERHGRIAVVTINRPESRNALDQVVAAELWEAWLAFRDDPDLWVQITTGAGDVSFCAGADLKANARGGPNVPGQAPYWAVLTNQWRCWKPQIAAVNGYALGGGLELALVHDLIVAAEQATFGLTEVRWGLMSGTGAVRLPRQIPLKLAMDVILTGRQITAAEGERFGFVNRVVPKGGALTSALEIAELICQNGPISVRGSKELAMRSVDVPLETALSLGPGLSWEMDHSEDRQEGPRAFAERRPPQFKGR